MEYGKREGKKRERGKSKTLPTLAVQRNLLWTTLLAEGQIRFKKIYRTSTLFG